jgi:hypothetical protein
LPNSGRRHPSKTMRCCLPKQSRKPMNLLAGLASLGSASSPNSVGRSLLSNSHRPTFFRSHSYLSRR